MSDCKLPDDGKSCIRLWTVKKNGMQYLSLLPCGVGENGEVTCVDLAQPDGKVLYCGVPIGLVNIFIEKFGVELIDGGLTQTQIDSVSEFLDVIPPDGAVWSMMK